MIKTIAKVVLPVDETLQIKRNRLEPSSCKNEMKRISFVTGSVQTAKSGIFESLVKTGDPVEEGTPLANIINTYDGEVMETLYAPIRSRVFFVHNEPLTYANTAVFKLVEF